MLADKELNIIAFFSEHKFEWINFKKQNVYETRVGFCRAMKKLMKLGIVKSKIDEENKIKKRFYAVIYEAESYADFTRKMIQNENRN
jgi:hypothetical protein